MVDFCTNGPVDKVTKPKFENLSTYISKIFHKFINQFRKRNYAKQVLQCFADVVAIALSILFLKQINPNCGKRTLIV